jgi:hypothetical protein
MNGRVIEDFGEWCNRLLEASVPWMAEVEPDAVLKSVSCREHGTRSDADASCGRQGMKLHGFHRLSQLKPEHVTAAWANPFH